MQISHMPGQKFSTEEIQMELWNILEPVQEYVLSILSVANQVKMNQILIMFQLCSFKKILKQIQTQKYQSELEFHGCLKVW